MLHRARYETGEDIDSTKMQGMGEAHGLTKEGKPSSIP
jgi:hypothetical protein